MIAGDMNAVSPGAVVNGPDEVITADGERKLRTENSPFARPSDVRPMSASTGYAI